MNGTVTWGLLAAWVIHDAEELATMSSWARTRLPRLRERYPWLPGRVWRAMAKDQSETTLAIAGVGLVIAAASVLGAASGGKSVFYQLVLAGFGLHAVVHLGFSTLVRGYTPGVVTALVVVAPFSLWAWRRLAGQGLTTAVHSGDVLLAVALLPVVIGTARLLAWLALRNRGRAAG